MPGMKKGSSMEKTKPQQYSCETSNMCEIGRDPSLSASTAHGHNPIHIVTRLDTGYYRDREIFLIA